MAAEAAAIARFKKKCAEGSSNDLSDDGSDDESHQLTPNMFRSRSTGTALAASSSTEEGDERHLRGARLSKLATEKFGRRRFLQETGGRRTAAPGKKAPEPSLGQGRPPEHPSPAPRTPLGRTDNASLMEDTLPPRCLSGEGLLERGPYGEDAEGLDVSRDDSRGSAVSLAEGGPSRGGLQPGQEAAGSAEGSLRMGSGRASRHVSWARDVHSQQESQVGDSSLHVAGNILPQLDLAAQDEVAPGTAGRPGGLGAGDRRMSLQRKLDDDDERTAGNGVEENGEHFLPFGAPGAPWADDAEDGYDREQLKELDDCVITELYKRTKAAQAQQENYKNAGFFLLFVALYFAILFLQANSGQGYQVTKAHEALIPEGFAGTQPNSFNGPADFYNWLNNSIIQPVWQDPYCGDGTCSQPLEFPSFGNFGCELDCGPYPNVTNITLLFNQNFNSDDDRQASSWNLCMVLPVSQCWFDTPQPFPALSGGFMQQLSIIDGDWKVLITAPYGGVSGAALGPSAAGGADMQSMVQLVQWGQCLPPENSSVAQCRETCADLISCLANHCSPTQAQAQLSGAFVDCVHQCNQDTDPLLQLKGQACQTIASNITSLLDVKCTLGGPGTTRPLSTAAAAVEHMGPAAGVDLGPLQRLQMWSALGSTDEERMFHLRVAVNRVLYTAVKDVCLVDHAKNLTADMRDALSAFLCTLLGGNASVPGCSYAGATTVADLWSIMFALHKGAGYVISRAHQERFVALLVAALQSTVKMDDTDAAAIDRALHIFDSAIVNDTNPGCHSEGPVLSWGSESKHNTTIQAGGRVIWQWLDDNPHSIKVAGDTPPDTLRGFGSGRQVLSRLTDCTPELIGVDDDKGVPTPCIIRPSWETPGEFTYAQIFPTPGVYTYEGGRLGGANSGQVTVLPTAADAANDMSANLTQECAPGCPYWQLSDGQCDAACGNTECAFDGGDCACVQPGLNFPLCNCPFGQSRSNTGVCCESSCVGENIAFEFSIRTYGGNPEDSVFSLKGANLSRYINRNRLLFGLILTQERVQSTGCSNSWFRSLATCTGQPSTDSFGVNPHFLPSSSLYKPDAEAEIAKISNGTLAFKIERNADGLPYGFIWPELFKLSGRKTYPLVFDVNLNNMGATHRLQYLVDGFYLDNLTNRVDAFIITYNGDAAIFTVMQVTINVNEGGAYVATYGIQTVPVQNYNWSATSVARFVLEIIFMLAIAWNFFEEVVQLINEKVENGHFRGYFKSAWNWIDLTSLAIQITGIGLWIYIQNLGAATYDMQPRYNVYFSLMEFPRYWAMPNPPIGYYNTVQDASQLQQIINVRYIYFSLQGINVFLVTLRLLKLLDFQPYLGIITRSIALAAPALLHFFIVWLCVFTSFALFAYLVFGSSMEEFSNLWRSFLTCFLVMMNDNGVTYNFIYLQGWEYAAAMIWWFAFVCVIIFVLLNFLIAIIVEAFMDIKEGEQNPTTIGQDVQRMFRLASGRYFGPYCRYQRLIKHLYALGADDFRKQEEGSMRRSSLMRAIRGLNVGNLLRSSSMFRAVEPTKLVLKVNDGKQCIDPISLHNIVERSYERNVDEAATPRKSARWKETLESMRESLAHQHTHGRDPPQREQLDRLSGTLMGMFGEEVEAAKVSALLPSQKPAPARKQEMAEIKGRLQALQADTADAFAELRSMIMDLKDQIGQLKAGQLAANNSPSVGFHSPDNAQHSTPLDVKGAAEGSSSVHMADTMDSAREQQN